MRTKASRTVALASAFALVACSGGLGSSGATDSSSKKDEASSKTDPDTPDAPASLSGSYLADHMACVVPKLAKGDKYISACCVLADKKNHRIKLKGLPNDTFKFAPPPNKATPAPKIEALNLTSFEKQACHVVYRAPLPGAKASTGLGLNAALDAKATVKGFFESIPLFKKLQTPVASGANAAKTATQNQSSNGKLLAPAGGKKAGLALGPGVAVAAGGTALQNFYTSSKTNTESGPLSSLVPSLTGRDPAMVATDGTSNPIDETGHTNDDTQVAANEPRNQVIGSSETVATPVDDQPSQQVPADTMSVIETTEAQPTLEIPNQELSSEFSYPDVTPDPTQTGTVIPDLSQTPPPPPQPTTDLTPPEG